MSDLKNFQQQALEKKSKISPEYAAMIMSQDRPVTIQTVRTLIEMILRGDSFFDGEGVSTEPEKESVPEVELVDCPVCEGCGSMSDEDTPQPWYRVLAEADAGDDRAQMAIREGKLAPFACPKCNGECVVPA